MSKNTRLLIIVNSIRKIIEIFLGPFLTAYIFKVSTDSVMMVSLYNIFAHTVIAFFSLMVGAIIKNKYEMQFFRLGMISKFLQLIILTLLGKKIIKYIWLVAMISGFSTITWYFPLNLFSSTLVPHKEKKEYIVYKSIITNVIMVALPIVFGAIISEKSFEKTTIIVLVLSFIQILVSFQIDYKKKPIKSASKFNLIKTFQYIKDDKNVREFYKTSFFLGMTCEGALNTTVTLLIIIAFNKDFSFGIVTSITYLLSIISAYICKKLINPHKIKMVIYLSGIIPLLSTIVLLFVTNQYTIVGYNIIYTFFIQIITIINDVKTIKITNSDTINDSNRVEGYALMEVFLGFGRIISYGLLLIVGMLNSFYLLKILIMLLTLCILLCGRHLTKIEID